MSTTTDVVEPDPSFLAGGIVWHPDDAATNPIGWAWAVEFAARVAAEDVAS